MKPKFIQTIVDWYVNLEKRKRDVDSCGAWPLAIPPWADIFISCCAGHDATYQKSEVLYARGIVEQNLTLKSQGLDLKQIADIVFAECVRARYRRSFFALRLVTKLQGEQYIKIVLANGDRIWFQSVGRRIADFESGDTPVIQLALKRSKLPER